MASFAQMIEPLLLGRDLSPDEAGELMAYLTCGEATNWQSGGALTALRIKKATAKELGFRTVFNQLGPLANPASAKRQLVGVYDPALAFPMAEALMKLGTERALVAHGEDGLDEVSPVAPTRFALLWEGELSEGILTPNGFGLKPVSLAAVLPGATAA